MRDKWFVIQSGERVRTYLSINSYDIWVYPLGQPIDEGFGRNRSDRIELSTEQRLALYDRVIQTTRKQNKDSILQDHSLLPLTLDLFDEFNKKYVQNTDPKDDNRIQITSKMRDLKRRPPSYRSKSGVHTKGKSYTEIIGQVIENHCKTFEEKLKSNQTESFCQTRKQSSHKTHSESNNKKRHQSQERHKRHRHQKH